MGKIRIVNFNNIIYGKRLDEFLPISMKNPQPEDNILTQKSESMQVKIEDGELNY